MSCDDPTTVQPCSLAEEEDGSLVIPPSLLTWPVPVESSLLVPSAAGSRSDGAAGFLGSTVFDAPSYRMRYAMIFRVNEVQLKKPHTCMDTLTGVLKSSSVLNWDNRLVSSVFSVKTFFPCR